MRAIRTPVEACALAHDIAKQKVRYVLGTGGRNPSGPLCTTKDGKTGSDCIGFVLYCLGLNRYQPRDFHFYDGWMNTDSVIAAARQGGAGWERAWDRVYRPQPGDLVVYPGITRSGVRVKIGHVGLVTGVPDMGDLTQPAGSALAAALKSIEVVDCNASFRRRLSGYAVGVTAVAPTWNRPDAMFIRFTGERGQ